MVQQRIYIDREELLKILVFLKKEKEQLKKKRNKIKMLAKPCKEGTTENIEKQRGIA